MSDRPVLIERPDEAKTKTCPGGKTHLRPRRRGRVLMAAGLACLAAAIALVVYNAGEDRAAGEASTAAAERIQATIAERAEASELYSAAAAQQTDEAEQVVEIGGYTYLGILRIPALSLELPVMADWSGDYEALKVSPVRQFGTVPTGSLVIAGHNYTSHFGGLSRLAAGDEVTFTTVSGTTLRYTVESVQTVAPESVDYVQSLEGLTLYTCTYGGQSRVVVHCNPAS